METLNLTRDTVRATVSRVIFRNEQNGFAVLRLVDSKRRELVAVGPLGGLEEQTELELTGYWERHAEFGKQLRVESFQLVLPSTEEGIRRFLGSGAIPGIGRALAGRIVDYFGADTLRVLEHESRRLTEVPKIGPAKAAAIAAAWRESSDRRNLFIFLQGLGLSSGSCVRLYQRYGAKTAEVVRRQPYRLAREMDGIGFRRADELAAAQGVAPDSPERLAAGADYLAEQLADEGHCCCPRAEFLRRLSELLAQPPETVAAGLELALTRRSLRELDGAIYPPRLARAELELPELAAVLCAVSSYPAQQLKQCPPGAGLTLNPAQLRAAALPSVGPISIITGGPGVGKTTVIGELVRRARHFKLTLELAAPTGRAARRLAEAAGLPARTLHRLLQFDPVSNRFGLDREHPLKCELLIVDEVSMLDLPLALALFRALTPGTALVLVGDRDQLPSVGPGTVLASFLESGRFPAVELTEVFRQAADSAIIANAHRVNRGLLPLAPPPGPELADFYWLRQDDPERAAELIERLVAERIPERFGFDPRREIQVLSPMNRGSCGVAALNLRLQARLNRGPAAGLRWGEREFRPGDKVLQLSNNYEHNVFNGDLGRVGQILFHDRKLQVGYDDGRVVTYAEAELEQLTLGYAITVHKAQGSEFPAVVLPLLSQHFPMLQRHLLYTAMTRARKLLILIGGERPVRLAVENARREPRWSRLTERLRAATPGGV